MARLRGEDRGLFERPKGSGVWWIRYTDSAGVERREKVGRSKVSAKQLYLKRKDEARRLVKLGPLRERPLTVAELIEKYEGEILSRNHKSAAEYRRQGKLWKEELGDRHIGQVTAGEVESWKARRRKTHAASTVNLSLRYLKMLFNLAIRDQLLEVNPLARGRVREYTENNIRDRIITEEEEAKFPDALPRWLYLAAHVALNSGLRQSELIGREQKDIDLTRRTLTIRDAKGGGRQVVKLNEDCVEALREILGLHAGSRWLFPNQFDTGPRDGTSVTKLFQRQLAKFDVLDATWHCLRHTFISRLCMLGVPLPTVQKLARHKSITMTLRYAHLCPDHQDESLELLAKKYSSLRAEAQSSRWLLRTLERWPTRSLSIGFGAGFGAGYLAKTDLI